MSLPLLCTLLLIPGISHVSLGSHYCMNDCNIQGQREASQYELMCCDPVNMGRYILFKEDHRMRYISCPSSIPDWCRYYMRSCSDILITNPDATSGYYNLIITNGSTINVYCDMEGSNCGGEGGWTRIAFINMSEPGTTCPTGLTEEQYDNITYNLCVNNYMYNYFGCSSTFFSSYTLHYTKVCGRLRGYTRGRGLSFIDYHWNPNVSITEPYLNGVSISHDNKHIWSYANAYTENTNGGAISCPCSIGNHSIIPPFVGNDYYCESGAPNVLYPWDYLFFNDPLWDGQQCNSYEITCCTTPNMPWFIKTLNETVSDDIQLRVCGQGCTNNNCYQNFQYYDTPLDLIELYIK